MSYILTPVFRVSYPNVFRPKMNDLSKKEEYSLVCLFPKGADLKPLQAELLRAAKEKWGDGATIIKTEGGFKLQMPGKVAVPLRIPLRDQGEKEGDEGMPAGFEKGAMFMNLRSNQKPGLVDPKNQDIIEESLFYAGCYAKAAINAFAYDNKGKGVSFGLQALQKVKDGEPLGATRVKPQDAFAPIEDVAPEGDAGSLFE